MLKRDGRDTLIFNLYLLRETPFERTEAICMGDLGSNLVARMNTEMGKIADALANAKENQTPLQIKLSQLSRVLTILVLAICAVIFVVGFLRVGSFSGEVVLNSFMALPLM